MKVFLTIGLFLVSCTIFSRSENIENNSSDEKWRIVKDKSRKEFVSEDNEFDWPGGEIDANKIGCWRYCVKKRVPNENADKELIKRVNIIWNVVDEAKVTLTEGSTNNSGSSLERTGNAGWDSSTILSEKSDDFYRDDSKCELYIELGCKSPDRSNPVLDQFSDTFSNLIQRRIVWKNDIIGPSSNVFTVDEDIKSLRISAFGNLSQIVLEIPIARRENNEAREEKPRPTFSLSRTSDALGLLVDVRDPPPGGWRLNFQGLQDSNYTFSVTAVSPTEIVKYSNVNDFLKTDESSMNRILSKNGRNESEREKSGKLSRPQRLAYPERDEENDSRIIKSDDEMIGQEASFSRNLNTLTITRDSESSEMIAPRNANLEAELMDTERETASDEIGENARILNNPEVDEFPRSFERFPRRKRIVIDIDPSTELVLPPGRRAAIGFIVTNNEPDVVSYTFRGTSTLSGFPGTPYTDWVPAGQSISLRVDIAVPDSEYVEPIVVTLSAKGRGDYDVAQKSAYVYVQGARSTVTSDSEKPYMEYRFNDNCSGKLHRDRCYKSQWSVEVTVNDSISGLKTVTSSPPGIEPRSEYISGTKNKVTFYYSASCCQTTVDITALDVQGNYYTRRLDVTAWDNLNDGEIAAIVVGSLLILLIIIFIILIIIYCVRKRKSHDLSYSQRYGSRPPAASTERSNF